MIVRDPKTNKQVDSEFSTDALAAQELASKMDAGIHRGRAGDFPREIYNKTVMSIANPTQRLSPSQRYWLHALANSNGLQEAAQQPRQRTTTSISGFSNVREMVLNAQRVALEGGARRAPQIVLSTIRGGIEFIIYPASARSSSNPGGLYLKTNQRMGSNGYLGKVVDDVFEPVSNCPEEIIETMRQFQRDPEGFALEHSRRVGKCCFCNKRLTTPASTAVGYGPRCASKFNLRWGNRGGNALIGSSTGTTRQPQNTQSAGRAVRRITDQELERVGQLTRTEAKAEEEAKAAARVLFEKKKEPNGGGRRRRRIGIQRPMVIAIKQKGSSFEILSITPGKGIGLTFNGTVGDELSAADVQSLMDNPKSFEVAVSKTRSLKPRRRRCRK